MTKVSRRDFLKTAAAGAAAAGIAGVGARTFLRDLIPPVKAAAQDPIPINSAIVIGSGFAGLTTAYLLNQMGKTVTVLERCHRPGGRVQQHNYPDGTHCATSYEEFFDKWVNPDMWWLLTELGYGPGDYTAFPSDTWYYWRGKYVFDKWSVMWSKLPWDDAGGLTDFNNFCDEVVKKIGDFPTPYETSQYPTYDFTDMKTWMLTSQPTHTTPHRTDVEELINMTLKGETSGPNEWSSAAYGISSWYWWYYAGFYELNVGNYNFIERLMSRLPAGTVHLNEEVSSVTNTATGVKVVSGGKKYTADVAIVAVDHPNVAGIVPELPADRKAGLDVLGKCGCIRPIAQFTERYWDTKYGMYGWGGYTDRNVTRSGCCIPDHTVLQKGGRGILSMYINEPEATSLWKTNKGIHFASKKDEANMVELLLNETEKFWPGAHDYYVPGSGFATEWMPYGPMLKPRYVLDGTYAKNRLPVGKIYFAGDYVYGFSGSEAVYSAREVVKNFT